MKPPLPGEMATLNTQGLKLGLVNSHTDDMVTIASTHFIWITELTVLFPHLALCLETENSTPSDDHPGKQNERLALFTLS